MCMGMHNLWFLSEPTVTFTLAFDALQILIDYFGTL